MDKIHSKSEAKRVAIQTGKEVWKKYHSCCDWFYENVVTGETRMFCGLEDFHNVVVAMESGKKKIPASLFNTRETKMKEFEKNKIIVTQ